jgi:hypothetical protein
MAFAAVWDYQVKPGDSEKMAGLIQTALTKYKPMLGTTTYLNSRIYTPSNTRCILMNGWESFADMEQWDAAFSASPAGQEFWPKWNTSGAITRGGEYWDVLETPANWAATGKDKAAIVEVLDWQVRAGDAEKIIDLMKETDAQYRPPAGTPTFLGVRAYSPSWTRYIQMNEWRSYTEMEQWYAAFGADPIGQEHFRKMSQLVVSSQGAQYWDVLGTWKGSQVP